jgi:hypothetical protein
LRFQIGLEHAVGEAERQHVLHGLLAQVVVDAEDLGLVEDRQHFAVELERLLQARAERLLDHHAHLGVLVPLEPVLAELANDHREELRRGGEVEDAVERDARLLVELAQLAVEATVDGVVVEGSGHVAHLLQQLVEHLLVRLPARVLRDRLAGHLAVVLVRDVRARDGDQVEALGQRALVREVVDGRQELALGEVARAAEYHERRRVDREALEALDQRVGLLLDDGHGLLRVGLGLGGRVRSPGGVAAELVP